MEGGWGVAEAFRVTIEDRRHQVGGRDCDHEGEACEQGIKKRGGFRRWQGGRHRTQIY